MPIPWTLDLGAFASIPSLVMLFDPPVSAVVRGPMTMLFVVVVFAVETSAAAAAETVPCWELVTWKKVPGSPTPMKRVEMMLGQAAARSLCRVR